MNAQSNLWTVLLGLVCLTFPARAQDGLLFNPEAVRSADTGNFSLVPADTPVISTTPLFLEDKVRNRNAVSGTANGLAVPGSSGVDAGKISIEFDFLRPLWSFRDFTQPVPPQYTAAFPANLGITHADDNFAVVPQVRYDYHVADQDFNVAGEGSFLSLSGRIQRQAAAAGSNPSGAFVANYTLTQVSIIPIQASRRFNAEDLFTNHDSDKLAGAFLILSIGTRYVSVDQSYTSDLTGNVAGGTNLAHRSTSQNFRGLGLTASAEWQRPIGENWIWFTGLRGSLLVGDSKRSGSFSVNATGMTGAANSLSETRTTLLPVAEGQFGYEWGDELGGRLARREVPPEFTIRIAGVGQYWGGLGPLSASGTQGFRTSDLFLVGVSIQVGLRH